MNEFLISAFKKLIENVISVKVWVIFALLVISSIMVFKGFMSATVFASLNGGVISTVFALREAFKVAKVKSNDDSSNIRV